MAADHDAAGGRQESTIVDHGQVKTLDYNPPITEMSPVTEAAYARRFPEPLS